MMSKCPNCDRHNDEGAEKCTGCGAWLGDTLAPSDALNEYGAIAERLAPLLASGQMIEAIKLYRETTGTSLVDAKQAVEQLRDRGRLFVAPAKEFPLDASQEQAIIELLRSGKAIEAIRYYRQQRVTDLKTAKEAIEAIARQNGIALNLPGPGSAIAVVVVAALVALSAFGGVLYWLSS